MHTLNGMMLTIFELLGGVFFFNRKRDKKIEDETDQENNSLLCRYVNDGNGRKIGESISLDGDIIIIKKEDRFLGVPIKHIEIEGKALLVKGLIDFDNAYEMGEKWRKESFSEIEQKDETEGK